MKLIALSIGASLFFSAFAEDASVDQKLDKIIDNTEIIKKNTEQKDPLEGKTIGIALNPLGLLFIDKEFTYISGEVNVFHLAPTLELSFPFVINNQQTLGDLGRDTKSFFLDAHAKKYLGKFNDGFYLSGFLAYAHIEDEYIKDFTNWDLDSDYDPIGTFTDNRFGLGFGIGFKIYSKMGLFWGMGLNLGRYFIKEEPKDALDSFFFNPFSDTIFDIEMLKIGFAF